MVLLVAGPLGWLVFQGRWHGLPGLLWVWGVVPVVVAGLAVDVARWRLWTCQNRECQRIFQFLNGESFNNKSRRLQNCRACDVTCLKWMVLTVWCVITLTR